MDRLAVERALATYKDENCYIKKQTIKGHGMGVYATRSLTPGTEIGDYIGELLGSDGAAVQVRMICSSWTRAASSIP